MVSLKRTELQVRPISSTGRNCLSKGSQITNCSGGPSTQIVQGRDANFLKRPSTSLWAKIFSISLGRVMKWEPKFFNGPSFFAVRGVAISRGVG